MRKVIWSLPPYVVFNCSSSLRGRRTIQTLPRPNPPWAFARVDLLKESINEIGKLLTIDDCKNIRKKIKKEITTMVEIDELSKKFLHDEDALIISTVGAKGKPYIAGFYFMYHEEEGVIYILTRPKILTIRNIQRKPDVALLVHHVYKDDWKNQYVMIRGVAENVEDQETIEKVKAMRIKKYFWLEEEQFLARRKTWAVIRVIPSYFRSFIRARDTNFPELRPPEHSHW